MYTIYSVSFSADGKYLASGSYSKTIKLWSVESKREITTVQGHSESVFSVAFSPDGKYLASGSDDYTLKLWNIESQKEVITLKRHSKGVN